MERFKSFIEARGGETGGWRGEVPGPHHSGSGYEPGDQPVPPGTGDRVPPGTIGGGGEVPGGPTLPPPGPPPGPPGAVPPRQAPPPAL